MLKHLLQGRPLGHPLHPMLVHLPIGLFFISFAMDVATFFREAEPEPLVRASFYAMAIGVASALLAAATGFADYSDVRRDHRARTTATWHMILNVGAVGLYAVNLGLRLPNRDLPDVATLPLLMSLAGVGLLSVSGYLGGVMVYDDGIGVGRHRRKHAAPRETILRTPGDARDDGWIPVAPEAELHDGQTLRANVNGVVMAVAKIDGRLYAFQEFCTHRYGPLSEGQLKPGGQVVCPWHNSCFDLKTGTVCAGPAEEPIRVFEVEARDGQVRVRVRVKNSD